jgi:hypothetical protein
MLRPLQFASFDDRGGWILKYFEVLKLKLFVFEMKRSRDKMTREEFTRK